MIKRVPPSDEVGLKFGKQRVIPKRKVKRLSVEAVVPESPIRLKYDPLLKHMRWKVIDPAAWTEIRQEIFAQQGGKCAGCGVTIYVDFSELHHKRGKGAGKRCDGPCCTQLLCKDELLSNSTIRLGCHTLIHQSGDLREAFVRGETT